ncbi:MAG: TIGR03087 family PEP-CTERM/XrtA system glycosyltransferase [Pseudomonadota bacterium]
MARLLFLSHRIPYPPNKGDKIRSWHILKYLAARHEVSVGAFIDDPEDLAHQDTVRAIAADSFFAKISPGIRKAMSARAFLGSGSQSMAFYADRAMQSWVKGLIESEKIDAAFLFSSTVAQFVLPYTDQVPLLMDFVDMDSDKWRQYSLKTSFPMRGVYAREASTLAKEEHKIAERAVASFFVSDDEAALFRRQFPNTAGSIHALENGVDADFFDPAKVPPAALGEGPIYCFTGAMDYRANVDAVLWFQKSVWHTIRASQPKAQFYIVGGKPAPEIIALAEKEGVTVTGRVEDVRPYIARADVSIAPLQIARGIQNKVLEAMAMSKAIVATPQAFEGIDAIPGKHLEVAAGAETFASTCLSLSNSPEDRGRMGRAARLLVLNRYGWEARLGALEPHLNAALKT